MTSYKEKLNHVTTFIFDVDGVLTNGEIILFKGEMARTLNSRDGYAIQYAAKKGYTILIITGGKSEEIKLRLEDLGATEVCLGSSKKIEVYEKLKTKYQFEDKQVLYMGDDIPDYEVMQQVGIATCPQDAVMEMSSDFVDGRGVKNGQIGNLYGIDVYTTSNCPVLETAAENAAGGEVKGAMLFHKDAMVLAEQQAVRSQTQYKQEFLGTLYTADCLYGTQVLRPEAGLVLAVNG